MTRICRVCLQIIMSAECYSLNQPYPNSECLLLRDRCKTCVPEMDVDLTTDAVLCSSCYSTFTLFYNLRSKCLETEKRLRNELEAKNFIDLGSLVQQSQVTFNTASCLITENHSALPNENITRFLNDLGQQTIKEEHDGEFVEINAADDVQENASDLDAVFDQITEPLEPYKEYDKNTDPEETQNNVENKTIPLQLNGSLYSAGSSDFAENKVSKRSKKAFRCLDCDYSTSHRLNLQNHIKSHFGNKPYKCDICGYKALQKCFLKSHMTMHSGTQPFTCNQCDYKTAYRGNLQTHLRKHTGEKPYKCDICNNSYTQSNSLNRHIKTHANAKSLKCCMCDYRTTYKSHLRNHMMLHTAEKVYTCNICSQQFTQKFDLIHHMKVHTNV